MKGEFVLAPPVIDENLDKSKFIGADLLLEEGEIKHDKGKLIHLLREIITS